MTLMAALIAAPLALVLTPVPRTQLPQRHVDASLSRVSPIRVSALTSGAVNEQVIGSWAVQAQRGNAGVIASSATTTAEVRTSLDTCSAGKQRMQQPPLSVPPPHVLHV